MRSPRWHPICLAVSLALVGLPGHPLSAQTQNATIVVESLVLQPGEAIPRDYTPDGRNLSPPISWNNLPAGTRELAVICSDFGAGNPPPWVHWIVYGIPATATGLPEGMPIIPDATLPVELAGTIQGLNGWRRPYYRGPAPPAGTPHLYHFTVYALDQPLGLEFGLTRKQLLKAMDGHILGQGDLVSVYERF